MAETLPDATFDNFLAGLASQALWALGETPHPVTKKCEVDLKAVRYTIGVLSMLEDKTRGNLEPEEEAHLHHVLAQLKERLKEKEQDA